MQEPKVVIAARAELIRQLGEIGGSRLTGEGKEEIADWLISSGHLADSFYEDVKQGMVPLVLPKAPKRVDPALVS